MFLKRAIVSASLDYYDKAILNFNKSLHLDSDNYMAYFGKANMLYQLINKSEESSYTLEMVIKDYDKCIELNPTFAYAYFNRAYLKFQNENYIGAIEDYSEAINQSPSFAEAHLNRALILLILENNDQACKDLSKAGELGMTKGYVLINKYCNK
ncbi:MAG: tetratricopeptide repeat protein [Vicingaceae bacterium]